MSPASYRAAPPRVGNYQLTHLRLENVIDCGAGTFRVVSRLGGMLPGVEQSRDAGTWPARRAVLFFSSLLDGGVGRHLQRPGSGVSFSAGRADDRRDLSSAADRVPRHAGPRSMPDRNRSSRELRGGRQGAGRCAAESFSVMGGGAANSSALPRSERHLAAWPSCWMLAGGRAERRRAGASAESGPVHGPMGARHSKRPGPEVGASGPGL